jgi:protein SCO1/2
MKNKSYIGISFIILIFGILVIPEIHQRIKSDKIIDNNSLLKVNYNKPINNSIIKDTIIKKNKY